MPQGSFKILIKEVVDAKNGTHIGYESKQSIVVGPTPFEAWRTVRVSSNPAFSWDDGLQTCREATPTEGTVNCRYVMEGIVISVPDAFVPDGEKAVREFALPWGASQCRVICDNVVDGYSRTISQGASGLNNSFSVSASAESTYTTRDEDPDGNGWSFTETSSMSYSMFVSDSSVLKTRLTTELLCGMNLSVNNYSSSSGQSHGSTTQVGWNYLGDTTCSQVTRTGIVTSNPSVSEFSIDFDTCHDPYSNLGVDGIIGSFNDAGVRPFLVNAVSGSPVFEETISQDSCN